MNTLEVQCPICDKACARNHVGFNAHLAAHVRAGLLDVRERRNIFRAVFKGKRPLPITSATDRAGRNRLVTT